MTSFAWRTASSSLCAVAAIVVAGAAFAGDSSMLNLSAATPNNAHCSALGEGFFAVSGSDACIRISGYVAAGAEFGGVLRPALHYPGPFEAASTPTSAFRTRTAVSADARFDTPMGPGRLYIQVGHDTFQPESR
jgi:hypothetical protein